MRNPRAFTLVELLIAMSVTSLIVVVMLRLFMDGTALWQRYDQKLDTFREARSAMQMMARDFSGLRPASEAPVDFPMLVLNKHPDTQPEDEVNQEIYAMTTVRNQGQNDLCAVGYYCIWSPAKNAFVLRRQCTESSTTFDLAKPDPATGVQKSGAQAFETIFSRKQDTSVQTIDDLASYIWDLKVVIPETGNPLQQLNWPQGNFNRELPRWVEIRFKALGVRAAGRIPGSGVTRETWFQPDSNLYRTLILPGQQQFVTRIKLCR